MRFEFSDIFRHEFQNLPKEIQKTADKQFKLFLENPFHPSLNSKKLKGENNVWQARINYNYRFTFLIKGDAYYLLHIFRHK